MTEHRTKSIFEIFGEVKREIGPVGKTGYNERHKYNFRGIDAVVNAIAKAFDEHGVIPAPMLQDKEYSTVEIGKDRTQMGHVLLTVAYRFYGPAGDHFDAVVPGESMDVGDKATPKAMSVAYRTALLQALNLPTSDADPDSQSYERSAARQDQWDSATPAQGKGRQRQATPDGSEWETAKPASEPVTDMDWMGHLVDDLIPAAKDTGTLNDYWAEINQHVDEGKCTAAHAKEIKAFIRERGQELGFTSKQPEPNGKQPEEVPA